MARWICAQASHEGSRRSVNEDACACASDPDGAFAVVADGAGGGASGRGAAEVTTISCANAFAGRFAAYADAWWQAEHDGGAIAWSALAAPDRAVIEAHVREVLGSRVARTPGDLAILEDEGAVLATVARRGLAVADRAVWDRCTRDRAWRGMSATAVVAVFGRAVVGIAHVGDARVYRVRDGVLEPLTTDHTLLEHVIATQQLSAEELEAFPHKSVILRAIGVTEAPVEIDTRVVETRPGDLWLLCSDGISSAFEPAELLHTLVTHRSDAAQVLVEQARERSSDNVTAVLVDVLAEPR